MNIYITVKKEIMNFKENKMDYMGGLGRNEKGEMM